MSSPLYEPLIERDIAAIPAAARAYAAAHSVDELFLAEERNQCERGVEHQPRVVVCELAHLRGSVIEVRGEPRFRAHAIAGCESVLQRFR